MKLAAHCMGLICALSLAWPAWAEPTEADRATARALALEGHAALTKKDFATAADRFGRADAMVHAPTLVVDWARALQGLGRYVEAHEKYELVLREGVDASAPKSWQRALEDAKKELDALKPRLGWVTVILTEPSEATVKIDGLAVPPAAIGVKRAADPGFPEVTVSAVGYEPFQQTLTVGPGEEKTIEVSLVKLPEQPRPLQATTDVSPRAERSNGRRTIAFVALGVGGAGLLTGGVTGLLFLRKRGDLRDDCTDDRCPPASGKKIETYHTYGTASGVALGLGVVGLGAGIALLLTEPKKQPEAATSAKLFVRPVLGMGFVGAEGTFQ